jgi:hypothetical protein
MGSPLAKKFNGKTYRLYGGWHGKARAQKEANTLRREGKHARIINNPAGTPFYDVYVRG